MANNAMVDLEIQATKLEARIFSSSTKEDALSSAIGAVELYMRALKHAKTPEDKAKLKRKCQDLLEQAERIKESENWNARDANRNNASSVQKLAQPGEDREIPVREQRILWESSKLNGFIFPPWKGTPEPNEFQLGDGESQFIDSPELGLSVKQTEIFDGWRRPREALPPRGVPANVEVAKDGPTMVSHHNIDVVQDVISSIVYPYDQNQSRPLVSANGKYIFRLYFNGCFRKVAIDDRLPTSKTSRALHVVDRNNPSLLWPALMEKAYLKVRGGYDFPGSNSGTDLWVLTGWIPEQVFLRSDDTAPCQVWRRVFNAFSFGDVLLTMGTGKMTQREEKHLGLAGEHDYAVLDMKEVGEYKLALVKNPWSEGTVWKGPSFFGGALGNNEKLRTWTDELRDALPSAKEDLAPGTFWMDFDSVLQHFDSLYLNWNPGLFTHRQDIHFTWDLSIDLSPPGCFCRNPQYMITNKKGGVVWLLLSRHFKSSDGKHQPSREDPSDTSKSKPGFISLYAFDRGGQHVPLSDGALLRGPYVDSPQTLMRLYMPPQASYTIVVAEQSLKQTAYNFTLSAFSRSLLTIAPPLKKYDHHTTHQSEWTSSTAGGNAGSSSHVINPQFSIHLSAPSDLGILIETLEPDLAVNVKLVWSNGGKRVASLLSRDIVGQSGDYRLGCAYAEIPRVDAGTYTIVCSTFEPGQLGNFSLHVSSAGPSVVKPIPAEDAGRLHVAVAPAVFQPGWNRLVAPLSLQRITRLKIVAWHDAAASVADDVRDGATASGSNVTTRTALKVGVEQGQGPDKRVLVVSAAGEFEDTPMGVRTADVDLVPQMQQHGGLWLVLERLAGSSSGVARVRVDVLAESGLQIGAWNAGDG
ncbi:MAG: hypothetical protein M1819_004856 [Sarea resinae]|nr:MAG: hypothetical protein M1819_004856 [Sarea resinae]